MTDRPAGRPAAGVPPIYTTSTVTPPPGPAGPAARARHRALGVLGLSVLLGPLWSAFAFLPVGLLLALLGGGCPGVGTLICRHGVMDALIVGPAHATAVLAALAVVGVALAWWGPSSIRAVLPVGVLIGWVLVVAAWIVLLGLVLAPLFG